MADKLIQTASVARLGRKSKRNSVEQAEQSMVTPQPNSKPEQKSEKCRTGCKTQDHQSWGECLRQANIQVDRESLKVK